MCCDSPTRRTARAPRALGLATLALITTAPALSHAGGAFDPRDPRTGIQVAAFGGVGGFSNGAVFEPYDASRRGYLNPWIGAQAELGYRFVPLLSAGLHGTLQFLDYDRTTAGVPTSASVWADAGAFGLYARVHPLALLAPSRSAFLARFDVHAAIGFDFIATVRSGASTNVPGTSALTAGVAMPVSVGVDFALTSWLAVSVLGQWSYWTADESCDPNRGQQSLFYVSPCTYDHSPESYLFAGLGLRGTFNILH